MVLVRVDSKAPVVAAWWRYAPCKYIANFYASLSVSLKYDWLNLIYAAKRMRVGYYLGFFAGIFYAPAQFILSAAGVAHVQKELSVFVMGLENKAYLWGSIKQA